jgi:hypothetical protein
MNEPYEKSLGWTLLVGATLGLLFLGGVPGVFAGVLASIIPGHLVYARKLAAKGTTDPRLREFTQSGRFLTCWPALVTLVCLAYGLALHLVAAIFPSGVARFLDLTTLALYAPLLPPDGGMRSAPGLGQLLPTHVLLALAGADARRYTPHDCAARPSVASRLGRLGCGLQQRVRPPAEDAAAAGDAPGFPCDRRTLRPWRVERAWARKLPPDALRRPSRSHGFRGFLALAVHQRRQRARPSGHGAPRNVSYAVGNGGHPPVASAARPPAASLEPYLQPRRGPQA